LSVCVPGVLRFGSPPRPCRAERSRLRNDHSTL
jgi:hypothetical protein